jgi:hypothetical protein
MKSIFKCEWKQLVFIAMAGTAVYLLFRNVRAAEDMADMMREALQ